MSIDRRIVSILYFNGIEDVNKVEKFLGEKDNYYEVLIDGEVKKLKIPGKVYLLKEELKDVKESIQEMFEDFVADAKEEVQDFVEDVKEEVQEFVEDAKEEVQEVIQKIKPKKAETTKVEKAVKPEKKIKKVEPKKLDDEIDDFINSI